MESWSQLKVRSAVIFTILDFMWIYNKKRSMNSVAFRLAEILWNVQGNFLGQQGNLIYIGTGRYFTEATQAFASMPPGHCLGALIIAPIGENALVP